MNARACILLATATLTCALGRPGLAGVPAVPGTAEPTPSILVRKHCIECHQAAGYGLASSGSGTELSRVAQTVPRHYHVLLQSFLSAPQGPMKDVLGSVVHLSPAERDAIVALLESRAPASPVRASPAAHP